MHFDGQHSVVVNKLTGARKTYPGQVKLKWKDGWCIIKVGDARPLWLRNELDAAAHRAADGRLYVQFKDSGDVLWLDNVAKKRQEWYHEVALESSGKVARLSCYRFDVAVDGMGTWWVLRDWQEATLAKGFVQQNVFL